MFNSIYNMLLSAIFGNGDVAYIPEELFQYAQQFLVNLSALFTTAIVLLPFVICIAAISWIFRSFWR